MCSVMPDGADGVLVVCDVEDVEFAPRTVLRRQVSLAAVRGRTGGGRSAAPSDVEVGHAQRVRLDEFAPPEVQPVGGHL